ncbi:MAG: oxidoreductase [Xenococcaceae cyanobacterium]
MNKDRQENVVNEGKHIGRRGKEKIKVHHSLMEYYIDSGLADEFDIEVDYSNGEEKDTYGATEEDLDDPNFWLDF